MNNIGRIFMDQASEFVNPNKTDAPAKQIAQMWADYAKRKEIDSRLDKLICDALWADKHDKEIDDLLISYIKAENEIDSYFGTYNKEETPLDFLLRTEDFDIPAPAEKKKAHRRKTDKRHKAKNERKLRKIYARLKETGENTRKTERSSTDFKFYDRDIEELILKGKRLSEIGGIPKRYKNYSKATRNDPDCVMSGSGYKKSENWKTK